MRGFHLVQQGDILTRGVSGSKVCICAHQRVAASFDVEYGTVLTVLIVLTILTRANFINTITIEVHPWANACSRIYATILRLSHGTKLANTVVSKSSIILMSTTLQQKRHLPLRERSFKSTHEPNHHILSTRLPHYSQKTKRPSVGIQGPQRHRCQRIASHGGNARNRAVHWHI